jgi:hypothetical protein
MTATAEAIFWQAIEASAIRAHITSLDLRSKGRPGNVALARIKTGVPSQFLVTMTRDGAIIFSDLIGKLDVLYVHCPKCSRGGRYRVQHQNAGVMPSSSIRLMKSPPDCPKKMALPGASA